MDRKEYKIKITVNDVQINKVIIDKEKLYKLIWLLENHQIYIGVVNAYSKELNYGIS